MEGHTSIPQETKPESIDQPNTSEESKLEEAIAHTEVQDRHAMAFLSDSKPAEGQSTRAIAEATGKGKQEALQEGTEMEFIVECEPQKSNPTPTAEEKGKGREDPDQMSSRFVFGEDGSAGEGMDMPSRSQIEPVDIRTQFEGTQMPSEGQSGVLYFQTERQNMTSGSKSGPMDFQCQYDDANMPNEGEIGPASLQSQNGGTVMPSGSQIGPANLQDQSEDQNTPALPNENAPPPIPLSQDPSSETNSINAASSISNPILEVDNAVGTFLVFFKLLIGHYTDTNAVQYDSFSNADSAIDDLRQQ